MDLDADCKILTMIMSHTFRAYMFLISYFGLLLWGFNFAIFLIIAKIVKFLLCSKICVWELSLKIDSLQISFPNKYYITVFSADFLC